ncbi:MAG: hypothetical protein JWO81_1080 [Alphaproteobacteria bacterium]|nr:hypothetical protein [Alphaproteobacteria bacterium]
MSGWLVIASVALSDSAPLPPRFDPEGCDRVAESAKRAGSDVVIDGNLYCASADGDCELTPARIIAGKAPRRVGERPIPVHILRKEADDFSNDLHAQNQISFCYPPALWFPSEGHYRGRFYLRQETGQRYHMAFYPRVKEN